jgi:hypothetical protein
MSKIYITQNKNKISKITFKHPTLMHEGAEESIRNKYQNILDTKYLLHQAREAVRSLEEELKTLEKDFSEILNIVDIEFESNKIEENITKSNMVIQNYGNDIIGRSTY